MTSEDMKNGRGSILISYSKETDKEFINSFMKEIEFKDDDDDDIVHLFQCLEDCTDTDYCPPQLFIEQIFNFKLCVYSYEKNGYYYAFSTSVINFYGKGKTLEEARNDLMSFVQKSIRCGNGGIYPKYGSLEFEATCCESLFKKMGDNGDDGDDRDKANMKDSIVEEMDNDGSFGYRFDKEDMSARAFRKLFERLLKCKSKMCTLSNYNEWVKNGCQVYNLPDDSYGITLENGNIILNIDIDMRENTNVEKISFIFCDVSIDKLRSMIDHNQSKSV